jgi:hypothetical protein
VGPRSHAPERLMPSGGGGATGGCPGMRLVHAHEGSGRGRPGAAGKLAALLDTHPLSPHGERDCGASTSRGAKCPRAHGLELRGTGKRQSALQLRLGLVALLGLDHVRTKPLTTTRNLRLHVPTRTQDEPWRDACLSMPLMRAAEASARTPLLHTCKASSERTLAHARVLSRSSGS